MPDLHDSHLYQSFAQGRVMVVPDIEQYAAHPLSYFSGESLWEHTDLFDVISTHVLGALPAQAHFAAVLDMLEWWRKMGFNPPLSIVEPNDPLAKGGAMHA
jgi:hypothetical protein